VSVLNGLDALDQDRETKIASRRAARPIPPPKKYPPAGEGTGETLQPLEVSSESQSRQDAPVVIDVRDEAETAPRAAERPVKAAKGPGRAKSAQRTPAPADDGPLRAAQLYLDPTTDDHLRRIKAAALVEGSDVTNSAVVRRAVAELVDRYGYDGIVGLIDNDPRTARGKGRPRR
jgi:hypothetical protein